VANGFTIFGNGTVRTSLTIGAGGLYLENSRIHLSRGSNGSGLYLNGDVSTGGTATSFLQNSQTGAVAPLIGLSGVAGVVSRTFDIAGGGANLDVDVAVTNGAASSASLVKTGAGVLSFLGADANTYTGTTTINGGTLRLGKASGVTSVVGDIVVGTGGTDKPDNPNEKRIVGDQGCPHPEQALRERLNWIANIPEPGEQIAI
jgi:autotransporter-associated beta strand protein